MIDAVSAWLRNMQRRRVHAGGQRPLALAVSAVRPPCRRATSATITALTVRSAQLSSFCISTTLSLNWRNDNRRSYPPKCSTNL